MSELWKQITTEDGREVLFVLHKVSDITEAHRQSGDIIKIINKNNVADESHISLSSEDITIMLHSHSTQPITQKDWEVANQIETYLTQEQPKQT